MNGELARLSRSLLLPLVFGLATNEPTALPLGADTHFQRALAVIENVHAGLCPGTASQEEYESTIAKRTSSLNPVALIFSRPGRVVDGTRRWMCCIPVRSG